MIFWIALNVVVACMSWGKTPSKQSMNRHCDARNRACWIETFLMKEKLFGVLGLKRNIPRKFVLINKAKSAFFLVLFLVLLNPIIHIWYIYLHLNDFHGKCRQIHHTCILWEIWVVSFFLWCINLCTDRSDTHETQMYLTPWSSVW